jgi:hypothetical protein
MVILGSFPLISLIFWQGMVKIKEWDEKSIEEIKTFGN